MSEWIRLQVKPGKPLLWKLFTFETNSTEAIKTRDSRLFFGTCARVPDCLDAETAG